MLFIISGPSGCGKTTLVKKVLDMDKDIRFAVSYTTRKKRKGEKEGEDYYFISNNEFEGMVEEEKFVEWAVVHGHYYGTSKGEIEKKSLRMDLLLDIDIQGALQIRMKMKKAVFVFIIPPGYQELKKRLIIRGQNTSDELMERLDAAKKEIRSYSQFDFIVINDNPEKAARELHAIVLSNRCQLQARQKEIASIMRSFTEED